MKSWHSFECVFTNMYVGGIQTDSWGTFTLTLLASKHAFFLQCSFSSWASFMNELWLQVWQSIEFTPTLPWNTNHSHLTFLVGFWASPNEPSIVVLPTFILRPQMSRNVLQALKQNLDVHQQLLQTSQWNSCLPLP